jgi:hypothetical protein
MAAALWLCTVGPSLGLCGRSITDAQSPGDTRGESPAPSWVPGLCLEGLISGKESCEWQALTELSLACGAEKGQGDPRGMPGRL